jgi:hypothetical protein
MKKTGLSIRDEVAVVEIMSLWERFDIKHFWCVLFCLLFSYVQADFPLLLSMKKAGPCCSGYKKKFGRNVSLFTDGKTCCQWHLVVNLTYIVGIDSGVQVLWTGRGGSQEFEVHEAPTRIAGQGGA